MTRTLFVVLMMVTAVFAFAAGQGEEGADAMTNPTRSEVQGAGDVQDALGPDGGWIVLFNGDVSTDSELSVSGAVLEEPGAEEPRRKLALYAQDSDRNVTARYTLSTPQLTIDHVNTRIQGGIIDGDVMVMAEGFELRDATIEGNLTFASAALQDSAEIDDASTVTGEIAVQ